MEQDYIAKTALDEMVESDRDQMLKAMVPYPVSYTHLTLPTNSLV